MKNQNILLSDEALVAVNGGGAKKKLAKLAVKGAKWAGRKLKSGAKGMWKPFAVGTASGVASDRLQGK